MFKWSVVIWTTNKSGGVSKDMILFDTQSEAEDKFFDTLSVVGGNVQTKYLRVELHNADGECVDWKVRKKDAPIEPIEE